MLVLILDDWTVCCCVQIFISSKMIADYKMKRRINVSGLLLYFMIAKSSFQYYCIRGECNLNWSSTCSSPGGLHA